jgi:hypothetical protein
MELELNQDELNIIGQALDDYLGNLYDDQPDGEHDEVIALIEALQKRMAPWQRAMAEDTHKEDLLGLQKRLAEEFKLATVYDPLNSVLEYECEDGRLARIGVDAETQHWFVRVQTSREDENCEASETFVSGREVAEYLKQEDAHA